MFKFQTDDLQGQIDNLKAQMAAAGYDRYSAYDLVWQSLHIAAAAACRGSTPTGGRGNWPNAVLTRDVKAELNCAQLCSKTKYANCDAEVSIYGMNGKATENGQQVGSFYNYTCAGSLNGGSEVSSADEAIMGTTSSHYFSFCCCRK